MATAILLPAAELQFCDADGHPYAGGSLATYIPGTTTPKICWLDPGETALQTNPVILDAAGRCILYGSGDYRLILRDAVGNLIYDQLSSTVVSDAMQPVVSAPTIADAKVLLGITGFATAADIAAAVATETAARIAADTAETSARTTADANLQTQIDAINATLAGMAGPAPAPPTIQHGVAVTGGGGSVNVTFGTPFTSNPAVVASGTALAPDVNVVSIEVHPTNFTAYVAYGNPAVVPVPGLSVYWIAVGPV